MKLPLWAGLLPLFVIGLAACNQQSGNTNDNDSSSGSGTSSTPNNSGDAPPSGGHSGDSSQTGGK